MHVPSIDVLLVEASPIEARRFRILLSEGAGGECRLGYAHTMDEAMKRLSHGRVDVILLDLSGPGAPGEDAVESLLLAAGETPMVVLAEKGDVEAAKRSVERGARDYLLKNHVDSSALLSALRYAVELRRGAAVGHRAAGAHRI